MGLRSYADAVRGARRAASDARAAHTGGDALLSAAAHAAGPCSERVSPHGLLALREPGGAGWWGDVTSLTTHASLELHGLPERELVAVLEALARCAEDGCSSVEGGPMSHDRDPGRNFSEGDTP